MCLEGMEKENVGFKYDICLVIKGFEVWMLEFEYVKKVMDVMFK